MAFLLADIHIQKHTQMDIINQTRLKAININQSRVLNPNIQNHLRKEAELSQFLYEVAETLVAHRLGRRRPPPSLPQRVVEERTRLGFSHHGLSAG